MSENRTPGEMRPPLAPPCQGGESWSLTQLMHTSAAHPLAPLAGGKSVLTAIDVTRLRLTPPGPPFKGGKESATNSAGGAEEWHVSR